METKRLTLNMETLMREMLLANTPLAFVFWIAFGYVFSTLVIRPLIEWSTKEEGEE